MNTRQVDYTEFLKTASVGFFLSDFENQILDANSIFLNMTGFTRKDLKSGKISLQTYGNLNMEVVAHVKMGESVKPYKSFLVRKDGSKFSVMFGHLLADLKKRQFFTFVVDLQKNKIDQTKNKSKEEGVIEKTDNSLSSFIEEGNGTLAQLQKSQVFLDSVIENIPNMIFVKRASDLRFVRFNKAGEELLGYEKSDLLGKNDYDFFPKSQADFFIQGDRKVLSQKTVVEIPEEPINTKYGKRILRTKKIPIFDNEGHPQYLLGISEDITEKKKAEEHRVGLLKEKAARKEAEKTAKHFALLSKATEILSSSLDYKNNLSAFSDLIAERMADWCVVSLIDQISGLKTLASSHVDPNKQKILKEIEKDLFINWNKSGEMQKIIDRGQPKIFNDISNDLLLNIFKSEDLVGKIKEVGLQSFMFVPIKICDKTSCTITLVNTHKNKVYTDLDLSIAVDLAKRASFAIENARLYAKAQEASRVKTQFLANMSHEIRTPLGAVLGFAELLADSESLSEEQSNYTQIILQNGQQLLSIINDILDISKVESDHLSLEHVEFSLYNMIKDIEVLLGPQANQKGVEFKYSFAEGVADKIISDPTRVRQILINIVGNAIKFTSSGHVFLKIEADNCELKSRRVAMRFSVVDTGIGISDEQSKRLFQPFMQGDGSTNRKYGGTGLGLYLSKRLAQMLGGDLFLKESTPGLGSTFVFNIEVEVSAQSEELNKVQELALKEKSKPEKIKMKRKLKVLVVDDSTDVRKLVGQFVKRMGCDAEYATNGDEGIKKALKNKYDVVLMDIQMPEVDGYEALSKLRENKYQSPIVALTAHAMKGDRELCLDSGFDDYLIKPIDRKLLEKTLCRYS